MDQVVRSASASNLVSLFDPEMVSTRERYRRRAINASQTFLRLPAIPETYPLTPFFYRPSRSHFRNNTPTRRIQMGVCYVPVGEASRQSSGGL